MKKLSMGQLSVNTIKNDLESIEKFQRVQLKREPDQQFTIAYPSVYIGEAKRANNVHVAYVGETDNIVRRTSEHLRASNNDSLKRLNELDQNGIANLHLIGHNMFNKSATLLIEQMFMDYLIGDPKYSVISVDSEEKAKGILNRRNNSQSDFYQKEFYESTVFPQIWNKLSKSKIVSKMSIVENSALFANSPFKTLSAEQLKAKIDIEKEIQKSLSNYTNEAKIIKIGGLAGTGKSVLMSALFKDIFDYQTENGGSMALLTRQLQQLNVYQQIASKLNMNDTVYGVSTFINKNKMKDVVLVDEAHLLWSGNYGRVSKKKWKKDLIALKDLAKVLILIYDPEQEISGKSYLTHELKHLMDKAENFQLKEQWRIKATKETQKYINDLVNLKKDSLLQKVPNEQASGYELEYFHSAAQMFEKIKEKNKKFGLSRLVATFDWKYSQQDDSQIWTVETDDLVLPWNLQLEEVKKGQQKSIPWQEIPESIDEIGSSYTVQGSDLNYVGVILGPSIQYDEDNHSLKINPSESYPADATKVYNTYNDEKLTDLKIQQKQVLNLQHILNILMTRGVHGLYVYAVDEVLRSKLLQLNNTQ